LERVFLDIFDRNYHHEKSSKSNFYKTAKFESRKFWVWLLTGLGLQSEKISAEWRFEQATSISLSKRRIDVDTGHSWYDTGYSNHKRLARKKALVTKSLFYML